MPQAQGSRSRIMIQQETTFKQTPSPADGQIVYFKSETLRYSRNLVTSEIIRGNRNPVKPVLGNMSVEGDIVTDLNAYMGILFKGALGDVTTTGSNPPYTHTIKIGDTLPSFTIEKGFTDLGRYHLYNGCKINSLRINVVPEGFQEVTVNVMGAKESVNTTSFDTTPTDLGFQPFDGFMIATVEEGGTTLGYATAVDGLTITNNLDGNSYVIGGQGERRYLPEGIVGVSGTLRVLFESGGLYAKALNSTESSLKIVYQRGNGSGTAGNEYLEIFIPELIYQPQAPTIAGSGGIVVELPFQAFYRASTQQSAIVVTIKNTQATL